MYLYGELQVEVVFLGAVVVSLTGGPVTRGAAVVVGEGLGEELGGIVAVALLGRGVPSLLVLLSMLPEVVGVLDVVVFDAALLGVVVLLGEGVAVKLPVEGVPVLELLAGVVTGGAGQGSASQLAA